EAVADEHDRVGHGVELRQDRRHVVVMSHAAAVAVGVVPDEGGRERPEAGVPEMPCDGRPAGAIVPGAVDEQEGGVGAHCWEPLAWLGSHHFSANGRMM